MSDSKKIETILSHDSRPAEGPVNRPVYRGSTVTFRTLEAFEREMAETDLRALRTYGRLGNPNAHDFEQMMCALEGGYGAVTACSGLATISCALLAFTLPGDHILTVDTVYGPVRRFCRDRLARLGVEVEYFDPLIGGEITRLFRENTRLVYMESPGTKTFEVQDVPAIAAAAKKRGILSLLDNTWATPLFFRALGHGVDVSLHAVTKYLAGHSDLSMGVAVCAEEKPYAALKAMTMDLGVTASADELYLALRGLRTLAVRLQQHQKNAMAVIEWLRGQPKFAGRILYPALRDFPGHELWKRDFTGASGLFGFELKIKSGERAALRRFLDGLEHFPLGFSWGGYESLILPCNMEGERAVKPFQMEGTLLRVHIGLEDPADLIADLKAGFDRL